MWSLQNPRRYAAHYTALAALVGLICALPWPGATHKLLAAGKPDRTTCTRRRPCRIPIDIVIDTRYLQRYNNWRKRLLTTLRCTNKLFAPAGVRWQLRGAQVWDPDTQRYNLYAALSALRRQFSPRPGGLLLGIVDWDQRHTFAIRGGEIGLSQGNACVVPSWPRIENDCLILAHELAHLLGAEHVSGKRWIMAGAANPFHLPSSDPIGRIVSSYRFHPRNIGRMKQRAKRFFRR